MNNPDRVVLVMSAAEDGVTTDLQMPEDPKWHEKEENRGLVMLSGLINNVLQSLGGEEPEVEFYESKEVH